MMKLSKIPVGVGMILFAVGGSGLDSDEVYGIIMAVMALAGLTLMYAGWRCERAKKNKRYTAVNHRSRNPCRFYLDIDYSGNYLSKLK